MRRRLLCAVIALLAFTACTPIPRVYIGGGVSVRCEEDMPCWNCHTMGNHICGTLPRSK